MKKTIFVLEDHPNALRALCTVLNPLTKSGWHIIVCTNLQDAMRHEKSLAEAAVILLDRDCPSTPEDPDHLGASFHRAISNDRWLKCVSISAEEKWNWLARRNGAVVVEKDFGNLDAWARRVVSEVESRIRLQEPTVSVQTLETPDR